MVPSDGQDGSAGTRKDALEVVKEQGKARLDDTELNIASPKALQKVELDLDDAPFLEEEAVPEPQAQEVPPAPAAPVEEAPPSIPLWKRKPVMLAGAGLLLVLLLLATWFFILRPKPGEQAPPPPAEEAAPAEVAPPAPVEPETPPPPPELPLSLAPFLVEKTDDKGNARLVTIKIKIIYRDERLSKELELKNFLLRDGLYYNLKNKSLHDLTDKNNAEALRDELRGVVNNYLNAGQIETVLFDELLVK